MLISMSAIAQPKSGDLFREYAWKPDMVRSDQGKYLRIGGKLDYKINEGHFPPLMVKDGYIPLNQYVDLDQAYKAEMVIEKVGSHVDTKGMTVSLNGFPKHLLPDAAGIPKPQSEYMHHYYPVVAIPLSELKVGMANSFRFDVDTAQRWNWPQQVVYGAVLRIYYNKPTDAYSNAITLNTGKLSLADPDKAICQVDYVAKYNGLNVEGDGIYEQWHSAYYRGEIIHHVGTAKDYPYQYQWDTEWIPTQKTTPTVRARVVHCDGLIFVTDAIEHKIASEEVQVTLCKPYNQPTNWVTRESEFSSNFDLDIDPKKIVEARMVWTSWSPCYSNGIFINGTKVFDKEGPCYQYMYHEVAIKDLSALKAGKNTLSTGLTPYYDGKMVHGMEVQWPGVMVLIKHKK